MSAAAGSNPSVPWWKEPTKDQWYAYVAAWLGWTLDAFDFTMFLLIMHPIARGISRVVAVGDVRVHDHPVDASCWVPPPRAGSAIGSAARRR